MNDITILSDTDISKKNRIGMLTDYAISNGAKIYEKRGKQKIGRYWTSTCNPDTMNAIFIGSDGLGYPNEDSKLVNYGYGIGLRLGFDVDSELFDKIEKNLDRKINDGEEFEYLGEIENIVSDEVSNELDSTSDKSKLDYFCVRNKGVLKYFVSEEVPLYEYKNSVYAKVTPNYLGDKYKDKDHVWMNVKRIKWVRDNDKVISKNIVTGGIDFHNWYYSGRFNETSVYRYISNSFSKEIEELGNILDLVEKKDIRKKVISIDMYDELKKDKSVRVRK